MTLLVVFVVLSISFSFLCSILEAALLSITPSYIASLRKTNPRLFHRLHKLKNAIDDPLAAILTLNTIAHTAGATGVGAEVAVLFGEAWLGLASAAMTLAILIFSEIIPKTIGAKYWRTIAPILPACLRVMALVLMPFVWLSKQITKRLGSAEDNTNIRGEISALAEIGFDRQELDHDEQRIIQNVLKFHEIKVNSVMTPATVCKYISPEMTTEEFIDKVKTLPFSRYPVIAHDGMVQGYIHKMDLISVDKNSDLMDKLRSIKQVRSNTSIELLFSEMLKERQHVGIVYDEHGTWLGLVTLEDILETLLGTEIMDETDNVSNLRKYAKQRWSRKLKYGNNKS